MWRVTESSRSLVPTIPVQTISTETAVMLLQHLKEEDSALSAPSAWSGGLNLDYVIGRKFNSEWSVLCEIRLMLMKVSALRRKAGMAEAVGWIDCEGSSGQ